MHATEDVTDRHATTFDESCRRISACRVVSDFLPVASQRRGLERQFSEAHY